jgi:hypothetical protein
MKYLPTLMCLRLTWENPEYSFLLKCDYTLWLMRHGDFMMTPQEWKETLTAILRDL